MSMTRKTKSACIAMEENMDTATKTDYIRSNILRSYKCELYVNKYTESQDEKKGALP